MLVMIEGLDGAGKSWLTRYLRDWLIDTQKVSALAVHDPGSTAFAEGIRELLYGKRTTRRTQLANILAHLSARADLNRQVIMPALERGRVVICDRHYPSTVAYNWWQNVLSLEELTYLSDLVDRESLPDIRPLILYLNVTPEDALARQLARGDQVKDQGKELSILSYVALGYETVRRHDKRGRWWTLDSSRPAQSVAAQAKAHLERELNGY